MTVILCIIALVAIISLYDYFGSKSWQQTTSTVRNNTVFENRNKEYGAYVIRRDYNKTLLIIMLTMVFSTGAIFAAYVGFNRKEPLKAEFKPPVIKEDTTILVIAPKDVPEPEIEPVQQEVSTPETIAFVEPVVVNEKDLTSKLTEADIEKAKVGTVDLPKTGEGFTPNVLPVKPPITEVPVTEPTRYPEVEPEFPGGFPAMMKFIQNNMEFPEVQIAGKVKLQFVIEADGSISSVKLVKGITGCDDCGKAAVKVVKKMPKWKPGKINNKAVPTYLELPIVFEDEVY